MTTGKLSTNTHGNIPITGGSLPFFGHAVPLLRDPLNFMNSLPSQGDLVRVRLGSIDAVVVCDRELTREMLINDRVFDKGGPFYDRSREFLGQSLATCTHDSHRRLRRLIQPAFNKRRIAEYADRMSDCISAVADSWREGQTVDIPSEMLTMLLTAQIDTLFADSLPREEAKTMAEDVKTLLRGLFPRTVLPPLYSRLPLPANRRYTAANTRFHRIVNSVVAARRDDPTDRADLLSALLWHEESASGGPCSAEGAPDSTATPAPASDVLSNEEITDQIMAFFVAGSESTANAVSWSLYLVSQSPEIEERLHAEVDGVLAGAPVATYQHLPRLQLTDRIITETLRIYPPGWMFTRYATEDTMLGKYHIPAGTILMYSAYLIHHRPDYYPDSDVFDPDRWLPERSKNAHKGALIPFGGGARQCIGNDFAVTMSTLALATITARWRLQPVDRRPVRSAATAILYPVRLAMRPRSRPTFRDRSSVTPSSHRHGFPAEAEAEGGPNDATH